MIEFKNVCKIYDANIEREKALNNVSLKIEDGEFVYIIGANGSGKSTLVKLINCEERLTSGSITFDEYKLEKIKRRQIPYLRRKVGMVFQDFKLIDNMSVYDNVAFALRVTDRPAKDIRRKVPKILEVMGLTKKANCRPNELSGGEQQKVGIARAIVGSPGVLIADEPTGNVDPEMSFELLQMLDEINKAGTTVILVTHQRDFISKMPRRVVVLEEGKIIFDDDLTLAESCNNPDAALAEVCANEIPDYVEEDSTLQQQELPIVEEEAAELSADGFIPSEMTEITNQENL